MTLPLKYRPTTLDKFIGSTPTIRALKGVLSREIKDVPHVFLFTGPAGCGKTTLARIVMSELDCKDTDLTELDAAHMRGVDMVREVRRQMHYRPTLGKTRGWILDECHKLTTDAKEMFLKALEDTPDHVFFALSTTEPQAFKPTFMRRCMRFEVRPLSEVALVKYLRKIARKEGVEVPKKVRHQIARDSIGSPGMALMLLDKIIGLDEDEMLEAAKQAALEESETIELCRALINKASWPEVARILRGMDTSKAEMIRQSVTRYMVPAVLNGGRGEQRAAIILKKLVQYTAYNFDMMTLVSVMHEICRSPKGKR